MSVLHFLWNINLLVPLTITKVISIFVSNLVQLEPDFFTNDCLNYICFEIVTNYVESM